MDNRGRNGLRTLGRLLLWGHLFVCCVWLYALRTRTEPPDWVSHVIVWSVLGIQFTWGYTVGLLVGPGRARRSQLWWSLLTVFLPLYPLGILLRILVFVCGLPLALVYGALFVVLLACETFGGVLLGVRAHSRSASL